MVRVDNVGTIFMASNITTISPTKHMDIVNEYVKDGVVKIAFAKSTDSDSNILTKNKCRASWEVFKENDGWETLRCS